MMAHAEPACRLCLALPAKPSSPEFDITFARAIEAADIACLLLCRDPAPNEGAEAARLSQTAQQNGIAFLVVDDPSLALDIAADGTHVAGGPATYSEARRLLGSAAIVGVECGHSRHDAMELAEMGADYVAFGPLAISEANEKDRRDRMIAWWAEIFVVPCLAPGVTSADEAAGLARLGADFVCLAPEIWQRADAVDHIAKIGAALAQHGSGA